VARIIDEIRQTMCKVTCAAFVYFRLTIKHYHALGKMYNNQEHAAIGHASVLFASRIGQSARDKTLITMYFDCIIMHASAHHSQAIATAFVSV
jgi:hypothetical protein